MQDTTKKPCQPTTEDHFFTFRKYFPLLPYNVQDDFMSYRIRSGERKALQWFKTANYIIQDNNLPLVAKTFENVLGRNYTEIRLLITVRAEPESISYEDAVNLDEESTNESHLNS